MSSKEDLGEIKEAVKGTALFKELDDAEAGLVAKYVETAKRAEGDVLFKEGDRGDFLCFVIEGSVEVVKTNSKGEEKVVNVFAQGRCIGEMAVIDDCVRSATARVSTDARLLLLTREKFDQITRGHPEVGIKILKAIARQMSLYLRLASGTLIE
jgi:CRP/FNR family transcriptional regulator, cyclic AMP receptor protein